MRRKKDAAAGRKEPASPGKLAVRVASADAESARRRLASEGFLDPSRKVSRGAGFVLFPVIAKPEGLPRGMRTVSADLPAQKNQNQSLAKRLSGILSSGSFSKSFDIVGTVGILDVSGLSPEEQEYAAGALRQVYCSLTAVCTRAGNIEDEYRVRPLRLIYGKSTETIHPENGVRLKLDPAIAYFSARQAAERARVESLVGKNEEILVMFAGVGPFSILIAKRHPDCKVTSVELNPAAVQYMEENISLNKVGRNSVAIEGDVAKAVPPLGKRFDRVIMPLPKSAGDFLDVALAAARPGAFIHFYSFGRDFSETRALLGRKLPGARILGMRRCGAIAPGKFRLVFDVRLPE